MNDPTPLPRHLDAFGLTDRGRIRSRNEDQFILADLGRSMIVHGSSLDVDEDARIPAPTRAHLMLVADGMGGRPSGTAASTAAAGEASRCILETIPCARGGASDEEIQEELEGLVRGCDDAVRAVVSDGSPQQNPGSTLTLAYLKDTRLHVAHVGDSRCYLLREGELIQVTTDHTLAQRMVEQDTLRPQDTERTGFEHVLWNTLGGGEQAAVPDVSSFDVEDVDAVLVCTDGLSRHLDEELIAALLEHSSCAEVACQRLVEVANARGGTDNITAVVAYLNAGSPQGNGVGGVEDEAHRAALQTRPSRSFQHPRTGRPHRWRPDRQMPKPYVVRSSDPTPPAPERAACSM